MQDFSDKVAIVTGAAGALGRASVQHFIEHGARVAAIDISDETLDRAFPKRANDAANMYLTADLTNRDACQAAAQAVHGRYGKVDILANIAGGFIMGEAVHETSDKSWDFLFDLNLRSIMHMAAATVPLMLASKQGKIVNIAARAAVKGGKNMGAYCASKSGVMRLTESMAAELRDQGINVNCIMPGTIDTARNRSDMPNADHDKWVDTADIARVIGFLASSHASAVHGAAVPVDGLS
ncbi:MAG: SDR family NAD(P)-dependent oxidoreductase [Gammaproteobacteria bacterium]|nr:SDR family NAD(P)-dependent oxidoreductase [Gammaproteobacteria bacterium]